MPICIIAVTNATIAALHLFEYRPVTIWSIQTKMEYTPNRAMIENRIMYISQALTDRVGRSCRVAECLSPQANSRSDIFAVRRVVHPARKTYKDSSLLEYDFLAKCSSKENMLRIPIVINADTKVWLRFQNSKPPTNI